MPMDPVARKLGEALTGSLDVTRLDLAAVREETDRVAREGPKLGMARVEDHVAPGPAGDVPVRLVAPRAEKPLPVLLYLHGGGWTFCSIETHDASCRQLASRAGCAVVSVDYRLAPEHRYPAAAEDAYAATCWVAEKGAAHGLDASRLAVGGDSAGGNLAAAVALMARDRGGPLLRHQLLVYPVLDFSFETGSYRDNADAPMLTRAMMETFWHWYLGDPARGAEAYASPLRAASLADLPPAFVVTAEYDPLRDEGEAYARRLEAEGVPSRLRRFEGMIHGFLAFAGLVEQADAALGAAAAELRSALA